MTRLTYHENIDGTQFAHARVQVEVLIDPSYMRLQKALKLVIAEPGDIQTADSRYVNRSITIDARVDVQINLPPSADQDLISGADDVIRGDWNMVDRREGRWSVFEQIGKVCPKEVATIC
jgi:hypothetical protein